MRFPKRVYREGEDPDERFSLANERTFLAWIRTSLALISGGVALSALNQVAPSTGHHIVSIVLVLMGIIGPLYAWTSWIRNEKALRLKAPLPAPIFALPLAILVVLIGLALVLEL